jgi:DNA-binding NtrC family response regulator
LSAESALTQRFSNFEQWYVWWALEKNDFNQTKAAEELKTHRNNLVRRIHEWGWNDKVHAAIAAGR